jgi:zinc protease
MRALALALLLVSAAPGAHARLDLSNASVERLENGLTVILLEERTRPVVSIHALYKTGAKDDPAGRLGLAHFFEHMAFRGSKNFPDTGLVSEIYAAGGEWHGYTWIDSTNYFATAPKEALPLLLAIEADRMARLELREEDIEADRGAVLAEMNGYLNDPESALFDALIAAHFLTHPYRNNTIGYHVDVEAIGHRDIVEFYARHYAPANAIIAIVGDIDRADVLAQAAKAFQGVRKSSAPPAPLTAEIPRTGERRIRLSTPSEKKHFKIAYPAPAAADFDFAVFLVIQALLGASDGANFRQDDWGTPVGAQSPIDDAADDLRTWIIPTAEPYAFVISGSARENADEARIERRIQRALDALAEGELSPEKLKEAQKRVLAALVFDVETTEDAAHQLAYFAGIGAFDRLLSLEADVRAVTAQAVADAGRAYLRADQRTIAWLTPGPARPTPSPPQSATPPAPRRGGGAPVVAPAAAEVLAGPNGLRILLQRSSLSPTVAVKAVLAGRFGCDLCTIDDPAHGFTSVTKTALAADSDSTFDAVAAAIHSSELRLEESEPSEDPLARLEEAFAATVKPGAASRSPLVLAVSGDIDAGRVQSRVGSLFRMRREATPEIAYVDPAPAEILIERPKAQAAVGFFARAPGAADIGALATRIALYVLSHGYEGRLGKEAISRRGLAYYIDAQYRAGPSGGLVTLAAGVDPDKVEAFRAVMRDEIARLAAFPPTEAEIAEAKRHLLGRKISAAQSNSEFVDALVQDFFAVGSPQTVKSLRERLESVTRADVIEAAAAIAAGSVVTVRAGRLH